MILYTGGTFDILHYGHIRFLKRCKNLVGHTGKVIISLNTDAFIKKYKKKPPVMNYKERKLSLLELECVDSVIANSGDSDSKPSILKTTPDIIAIGSDWARKDYYEQMGFTQDWLDKYNIMLCYIPYTHAMSTTEIKNRILF